MDDEALFRRMLNGGSALDDDPSLIHGIWPDTRLAYVNRAYERAGRARGLGPAWGLGARLMDAIPGPLVPFYEGLFVRSLRAKAPLAIDYHCHSPEEHRELRMHIYPIGEQAGLLMVHSLLVARPHHEPQGPSDMRYRNRATGLVVQCCQCRRVRRNTGEWDTVPEYIARMPSQTSHGLCAPCSIHLYGTFDAL